MNLIYTDHALIRMAQRGISDTQVERVLQLGRKLRAVSALVFLIGKREAQRLSGVVDDIGDLEGIHVVVNLNGVVITVYRNRSTVYRAR